MSLLADLYKYRYDKFYVPSPLQSEDAVNRQTADMLAHLTASNTLTSRYYIPGDAPISEALTTFFTTLADDIDLAYYDCNFIRQNLLSETSTLGTAFSNIDVSRAVEVIPVETAGRITNGRLRTLGKLKIAKIENLTDEHGYITPCAIASHSVSHEIVTITGDITPSGDGPWTFVPTVSKATYTVTFALEPAEAFNVVAVDAVARSPLFVSISGTTETGTAVYGINNSADASNGCFLFIDGTQRFQEAMLTFTFAGGSDSGFIVRDIRLYNLSYDHAGSLLLSYDAGDAFKNKTVPVKLVLYGIVPSSAKATLKVGDSIFETLGTLHVANATVKSDGSVDLKLELSTNSIPPLISGLVVYV